MQLDVPRAAWVAAALLLVAIIVRQFLPSRYSKAFLRLAGPANASWLLGALVYWHTSELESLLMKLAGPS